MSLNGEEKSELQLLKEIEATSKEVRVAGNELSDRIKQFENWLNTIPGRVQTTIQIGADSDGDMHTNLTFKKDGKTWSLFLYDYYADREHYSDDRPLRDASLEEKMWAMRHFDEILPAMAKAQVDLVKRLRASTAEFDARAKSLGIKEGA